jgi:CxxC-x17-CxxC domain-containing protein
MPERAAHDRATTLSDADDAPDQTRGCADCGAAFLIPAAEAGLYVERGLSLPTRCPACRAKRRAERNGDLLQDRTQKLSRFGLNDHGTYGGVAPPSNGPRPAQGPRRYGATCSRCGAQTTVPFEPRRGRAVYCKPCFEARRGH